MGFRRDNKYERNVVHTLCNYDSLLSLNMPNAPYIMSTISQIIRVLSQVCLFQTLLLSIYLGLACNIASVALLVPAIGIFVLYR